MLSEEIDQLVQECPERYQDELAELTPDEIRSHRCRLQDAAGVATNHCSSSVDQIKSKPLLQELEEHQATRKDLLEFFVLWARDDCRPREAGELAQMLEGVIPDFESDTNANFNDFLDSYFPRDDKREVKHSLILVAILNGDR
mgnify:FL=1